MLNLYKIHINLNIYYVHKYCLDYKYMLKSIYFFLEATISKVGGDSNTSFSTWSESLNGIFISNLLKTLKGLRNTVIQLSPE